MNMVSINKEVIERDYSSAQAYKALYRICNAVRNRR